jgi:hypothetical protein
VSSTHKMSVNSHVALKIKCNGNFQDVFKQDEIDDVDGQHIFFWVFVFVPPKLFWNHFL